MGGDEEKKGNYPKLHQFEMQQPHIFVFPPSLATLNATTLNSTHTHTAASIAILGEFVASFEVFMLSR
jgi:hypothetical protein